MQYFLLHSWWTNVGEGEDLDLLTDLYSHLRSLEWDLGYISHSEFPSRVSAQGEELWVERLLSRVVLDATM